MKVPDSRVVSYLFMVRLTGIRNHIYLLGNPYFAVLILEPHKDKIVTSIINAIIGFRYVNVATKVLGEVILFLSKPRHYKGQHLKQV